MPPVRFIAAMVAAEVLGMLGISAFASLLPEFAREWGLSATDSGWISGLYYAGYVAAVPVLTAATDRMDPRRIYLASTALGGIANAGFALTAHGFWSAVLWQMLSGIGLAGTYMPGLKALTDRVTGPHQSRALASYTAGFSLGISASFLLAGGLGAAFGWRWAFAAPALGSALAFLLAFLALPPAASAPSAPMARFLDFRPVLANRAAMGFVIGYGFHVWELFGVRAWIVAFLAFSLGLQSTSAGAWAPSWVASLVTLFGVPASIGGNELALRYGRRRVLPLIMLTSALLACLVGFTAASPYWLVSLACLIYGAFVMADSASLTVGAVEAAAAGQRGATMAVHSSIGFLGAFLGPLSFGMLLDHAGGPQHLAAWGIAFASLGLAVACGAVALLLLKPR
jgi:predicted MFS family arabinose efflux permease